MLSFLFVLGFMLIDLAMSVGIIGTMNRFRVVSVILSILPGMVYNIYVIIFEGEVRIHT